MSEQARRSEHRRHGLRRAHALLWTALIAVLSLGSANPVMAAPAGRLLVLSKDDAMLAIVDPASLRVVARVPAGPDPHEVVTSADGKLAFVSNYGLGAYRTITEIDLEKRSVVQTIDLGALQGPHGLAFDDGRLWFTAEVAKSVGEIDPATGRIVGIVGIGQTRTHMIYAFSDHHRFVMTNVGSGTISFIDRGQPPPTSMPPMPDITKLNLADLPKIMASFPEAWKVTTVKVGPACEGFAVSPDEREIWVANGADGSISVVDAGVRTVTRTLPTQLIWPNRAKFTPDGKFVLVSQGFSPDVVVVDAVTGQIVKRISVGKGAEGLLIEPGGRRAFASSWIDNVVTVIDLKTWAVVGKIEGLHNPDGLAWAQD